MDGYHVVTRGEYDDGAALIDGEMQDLHHRSNLRVRHLTPYNFLIAPNGSPINNAAFDEILADRLNRILETGDGLEELAAEIWKLPRPRHYRDCGTTETEGKRQSAIAFGRSLTEARLALVQEEAVPSWRTG